MRDSLHCVDPNTKRGPKHCFTRVLEDQSVVSLESMEEMVECRAERELPVADLSSRVKQIRSES